MSATGKKIPDRPIKIMREELRGYPGASRMVEQYLLERGRELPDWPAWCFLPMAGWYQILCEEMGVDRLGLSTGNKLPVVAALGIWKYCQGIYRFSPELLSALADSPVSGDLPSDVLFRLPEWCVYVETPGMTCYGKPLHGFWAHLEHDMNNGQDELRFLLDFDDEQSATILHIGQWSVEKALLRSLEESITQAKMYGGIDVPEGLESVAPDLAAQISPLVSVLLYLCSSEPDIDGHTPGSTPGYPHLRKTKNGFRLFEPEKPRLWRVGEKIGEQLRQAHSGVQTGRTVATHIRRAHWHGFWTGPRTGERNFVYHWIPPLLVGSE
jgi:hypothetical protein